MKIHTGDTFAKKVLWYSIGIRQPAHLIMSRGVGSRHYCTLNTAKAIASGSFTEIRLKKNADREAVWLFFNSALGWLFTELSGRSGMGGGMLKVDPTDIRKLRVLNPKYVKSSMLPKLRSLLKRNVGTVEEEISAKDRLLIDDYILGEILGLSESEQDEIRRSVVELVKVRNQKAGSVKNGKKSRNGIDFDRLAFDAIQRPEVKEFIDYLRAEVISNQPTTQKLPQFKGSVSIENTLLGWRVKSGSSTIDCKSELEARYYGLFIEMRLDTGPLFQKGFPKSSSLKKMESLFANVSLILEEINSSILQRRIRDRFIRVFWAHVKDEIEKKE